jgi:hypothetical protein
MWANLSFAQRFALTLVIVLAIIFALALFGYLTGNWNEDDAARPGYGLASAETRAIEPCMDVETREKVRELMMEAIAEAFKEHIHRMYGVWMKDEQGQPERAARGAQQGIRAYMGSRAAVMKWNPPLCAEESK